VLDVFLALEGITHIVIGLEMDEAINPVPRRMSFHDAAFVLVHPPDKIIGYADVDGTAGTTCEEIDVIAGHAEV
jgi:hypothetical protein